MSCHRTINTMVFAYGLLGATKLAERTLAVVERADEVVGADPIRAELVNTAWQWACQKGASIELGSEVLRDAKTLFPRVVSTRALGERALVMAADRGHPAYDTLLVALAELEAAQVVTYNANMRRALPSLTISPKKSAR